MSLIDAFYNCSIQIQAHSDAEVARTKVQAEKEAAAKAAADFQARKNRTEVLAPPPPLTEEECILIIQVPDVIGKLTSLQRLVASARPNEFVVLLKQVLIAGRGEGETKSNENQGA